MVSLAYRGEQNFDGLMPSSVLLPRSSCSISAPYHVELDYCKLNWCIRNEVGCLDYFHNGIITLQAFPGMDPNESHERMISPSICEGQAARLPLRKSEHALNFLVFYFDADCSSLYRV